LPSQKGDADQLGMQGVGVTQHRILIRRVPAAHQLVMTPQQRPDGRRDPGRIQTSEPNVMGSTCTTPTTPASSARVISQLFAECAPFQLP